MATKLSTHMVEKPWGLTKLPAIFGDPAGRKIGEIWFDASDQPVLAKYIFTSERLSIQVHPNDAQAVPHGFPRGKTECWLILEADPDAVIGLGLKETISSDRLRSSLVDGSIEGLMDWRPVQAGDFFFVPPGTVHAIGSGISLLEFQQNADATFRLYDYGRPRELHLDDGVAVARPEPYPPELAQHISDSDTRVLADTEHFSLVHVGAGGSANDFAMDQRRWIMPLAGRVTADSIEAGPGESLMLEPGERIEGEGVRVLVGTAGPLGG